MRSSALIKISVDLGSQCLTVSTYVLRHSSASRQTQASQKRGSAMFPSMVTSWLLEISIKHSGFTLLSLPSSPEEDLLGSHMLGRGFVL